MIIIIDENFFAQPRCRLLGNKGETMSRRLEVRFPKVEKAQLYKLRFLLSDNTTCYELDVTSGEAYVSGSLLVQVGKVLCQWMAVGIGENEQYEVVAKSNVFEMFVDDSINSDSEPIPTYEQAADMFDRAVSTLEEVEKIVPQFSELSNKVVKNDKKLTELWLRHDADILNTQNSVVELGWRYDDEMEAMSKKHDADVKNVSDKVESEISNVTALINNAALPIVQTVYGDIITATDSADRPLKGLALYGKTTQDVTPTPEAPIEFESVGELITIRVTDDNEQTQSMFVMTPEGLRGIPALSDNAYVNYTDENGKKWICDEIDLERGVYIQRIYEDVVSIAGVNTLPSGLYYGVWNVATTNKVTQGNIGILSTVATPVLSSATRNEGCVYENSANIVFVGSTDETLETMKEKYNGTKVLYVLKEPIETPLTAEQIEAFKALHSYYPNTTVTNDSGAGMKISYTADTKTYIDNQFKVLFALISTM